jgi:hypothetical protein
MAAFNSGIFHQSAGSIVSLFLFSKEKFTIQGLGRRFVKGETPPSEAATMAKKKKKKKTMANEPAGGWERASVGDVLAVMKQHLADARVQENGCGALWNLALNNPANSQAIGGSSGVEVVVAAMQQHLADAKVQGNGCGARWNLASHNPANKQAIGGSGGVEVVVAAMQQHLADANVQKYGQLLLDALPKAPTPSDAAAAAKKRRSSTIAQPQAALGSTQPSLTQLTAMGFAAADAQAALAAAGNNMDAAVDILVQQSASAPPPPQSAAKR